MDRFVVVLTQLKPAVALAVSSDGEAMPVVETRSDPVPWVLACQIISKLRRADPNAKAVPATRWALDHWPSFGSVDVLQHAHLASGPLTVPNVIGWRWSVN